MNLHAAWAGRFILWTLLLLPGCGSWSASAQALARRGWAGAPISLVPWWRDAVFLQTTLEQLDGSDGAPDEDEALRLRLEALHELGFDALVLSPAPPPTALESFDRLISETSRRRLRVLVALPLDASSLNRSGGLEATARTWLGRGVGGFAIGGGEPSQVASLRRICAAFVGDRVLLGPGELRVPGEPGRVSRRGGSSRQRLVPSQLTVVPLPEASSAGSEAVERFLESLSGKHPGVFPAPAADMAGTASAELPLRLALLLLSRGAPTLIDDDLELGSVSADSTRPGALAAGDPAASTALNPAALAATADPAASEEDASEQTDWIRRLSALKHGEPALNDGTLVPLHIAGARGMEAPRVVGWLRRPLRGGPRAAPVVVLCNLSGVREVVSLRGELARLHALPERGRMRTLLRSGAAARGFPADGYPDRSADAGLLADGVADSGVADVGAIALEPFGVYAGAVGRMGGLEAGRGSAASRRSGRISR